VTVTVMYRDVIDVKCLDDNRLRLCFEGGEWRELDIDALVKFDGVFEPLRDRDYFKSVSVNRELGTIVWPNGADVCPDVLYERSEPGS